MGALLEQWTQLTERQKGRCWFFFAIITELITVLVWWNKRPIPPDYFTYTQLADTLANGLGYIDQGKAFTFFPPGYPFYLLIIHAWADFLSLSRPLLVVGVDLFVGAFTLLYFRKIVQHFLSGLPAELATFLWATYPFQLILYTQPNSEIPFLLTYLAAISHFLAYLKKYRLRDMSMGGLWLGISCLLRPITLYLAVVIAIYAGWYLYQNYRVHRSYWLPLFVWLASFCLIVLPWEWYVYVHNKEWILVQGKSILPIYEGLIFGHDAYHGLPIKVPADVHAFMDQIAKEPPTLPSIFQHLIHAEPLVLLKILGFKLVRSWYGLWDNPHEKPVMVLQFLYLFLAVWGIIRSFTSLFFSRLLLLPFVLILYYWGTTVILIPLLRYMIPAMPFVLLYVAFVFVKKSTRPAE